MPFAGEFKSARTPQKSSSTQQNQNLVVVFFLEVEVYAVHAVYARVETLESKRAHQADWTVTSLEAGVAW